MTNARAWAIAPSMWSSRSRDGPGRFSSGLGDIQHRARGTSATPSLRLEREGLNERGAEVGCELGDAGPRDAPVGAQEHDRLRVHVEPRFEAAGAVTHDLHI